MSGASIPYHLRPHKSVDRRLFVDLLTRFERWRSLSNHAYLSMGAYPLEDHKQIHRHLGITRLIAFDYDNKTVERQKFNVPIDTCLCLCHSADEIISKLNNILQSAPFSEPNGIVFWLDYTNSKEIGQQIREFEALLNKLSVGDIVRVTVNAQAHGLVEPAPYGAPPLQKGEKRERQFESLKSRIREFLPEGTSKEDMTEEGLPLVLSRAFGAAAQKAFPAHGNTMFLPLSIVRYADTEQMLSITGAVIKRDDKKALLDKLEINAWPFASTEWTRIHKLLVPTLTLRERLHLERGIISKKAEDIIKELGFDQAANMDIKQFIESYKSYYRFYPTLLQYEL